MNILGKITGIQYKPFLTEELKKISIKDLDINNSPTVFLLNDDESNFAVSKWVSPKRTRSYPYERVYNSLSITKKITIIPVVKDEGESGDRDFIQWDTISLMSLLDVYVILAYYDKALKKGNKITKQKFDNTFIMNKIKEIEQYHSSALHWNLNEIQNIQSILSIVQNSYKNIESSTGVKLHSYKGIINFCNKIENDVSSFMKFSREKAEKAQSREIKTVQPKEYLSTLTKASLTITNYLGGQYYFTVDEVKIEKDNVCLIESKHSKNSIIPSKSDIKDGLLKMILYSNLKSVIIENKEYSVLPTLVLSSSNLESEINTNSNEEEIKEFISNNSLNNTKSNIITNLIQESKHNNFNLILKKLI